MFTLKNYKPIIEEELEIKLTPVADGNLYIAQISSGFLKGTLVLSVELQKEDLKDFAEALSSLITQYNTIDCDMSKPQ